MTPWLSASIAGQVAIAAALLGGASAAQDRRPAQSGVEGPVPSRVEARAPGAVDDGPLPDQQALFDATRDNIARSESEQRFFAYKEQIGRAHV